MSLIEIIYIWLSLKMFKHNMTLYSVMFSVWWHCPLAWEIFSKLFLFHWITIVIYFSCISYNASSDKWWQKRVKTCKMKLKARSVLSCSNMCFHITGCTWPINFLDALVLYIHRCKLLVETRCPQKWTAFPETSNRLHWLGICVIFWLCLKIGKLNGRAGTMELCVAL